MLHARPSRHLPRLIRLRAMPALAALLLGAALLPAVPFTGSARAASNQVVVVPPEDPPPPLSDQERQQVPAQVQPTGDLNPPTAEPLTFSSPADLQKALTEDPAARTENSDTYQVNGADHVALVSATPVNYLGSNGDWAPIDNTLADDSGGLTNGANDFGLHFPDTLSPDAPVGVDLPQGSYTFSLQGGKATTTGAKAGDDHVTYPGVLPGVDLIYTPSATGLDEQIVLNTPDAAAQPVAFDLSTTDLTLKQDEAGEVWIYAADTAVGTISPPSALDSSTDPATGEGAYGTATWTLKDAGGGAYTLVLWVDPDFLAKATYPVTVDPGSHTFHPSRDGWTDSQYTGASHETDPELNVGNATSLSKRYSFIQFDTSGYRRAGRVVQGADALLLATYVANSGVDVNLKRVNADWPTSLTWAYQPGVDSGSGPWSVHGAQNTWYDFNVKDPYQLIIDSNNGVGDRGLRLAGSTGTTSDYHRFASAETTITDSYGNLVKPELILQYDDLPGAPSLADPATGSTIENPSPTLQITALPADNNGDDVKVDYQVSDSSTDFSTSHLKAESGWTDDTSWTVPAGSLPDGQPYWWRVQSADVCTPPDQLCYTNGYPWPVSAVRTFTMALHHFGEDSRWAMWTDQLGNGVTAEINESNGNLLVDVPLDSLSTPAGSLDLHLYYNSLDPTNRGLGAGWSIAAGPGADTGELPTLLDNTLDDGNTVKITTANGGAQYFSKIGKKTWSGSGVVSKDETGAWTYTASDGSAYTFDTGGKPTGVSPVTSTLGLPQFTYTFNTASHLLSVTDLADSPNRTVSLTWDPSGQKLQSITTWDNRTWSIDYDNAGAGNHLQVVHDPQSEAVTFLYDATSNLMTHIKDGLTHQADITYVTPQGAPSSLVGSFTHPGSNYATTLAYDPAPGEHFTGESAAETDVTDPRGVATTSPTDDYQTNVQFNTAGLPIEIAGPANNLGKWPTKTMEWDTNGNLLCSRSAAANAYAFSTDCHTDDQAGHLAKLSTVYVYDSKAPYRELSKTGPEPSTTDANAADRPVTTYAYDDGITGLLWQKWNNRYMTGVPDKLATDGVIDHDWGTGTAYGLTATDYFSLRWTGYLHPTTYQKYKFRVYSDDGVRLSIGTTTLLDCFGNSQNATGYNCETNVPVTKYLGVSDHAFTLEYSELTGNASVKVQWDQGTGNWVDVPQSVFEPNLGDLTTKTDPLGTTTYAYTGGPAQTRHLPDSETRTGPGGSPTPDPARTTSYTYDAYGRALTTQTAAGTATNVFSSTSPWCLDHTIDAAGARTNYACDAAGDLTSATVVIDAVDTQPFQWRTTSTTYDQVGRVKTVTTAKAVTTNTYDAAGNLTDVEVTDTGSAPHAFDRLTHYDYGTGNRRITETLPDPDGTGGSLTSPVIHYTYDDLGNQKTRSDPRNANHLWTTTYDASNRAVQVKNPLNEATNSSYDDTGEATGGTLGIPTETVTDPAVVTSSTAFDLLGRKTSTRVGSLQPTLYQYDPAGDVTKVTDPAGVYVKDAYNEFAQMVKATAQTGTSGAEKDTVTAYDTAGRITSVTDPNNHVVSYSTDPAGRITRVTPAGQGTHWDVDYDAAGDRVKVTDPDGRVRDLTYDLTGLLSTAKEYPDGSTTYTSTYHYDAGSELTSVDDPRGITLYLVYDNLGRRISRYAVQGSQTVDSESFGYDAAGNMTSAGNASYSMALSYDDAMRLYQTNEGTGNLTTYSYTNGRLMGQTDPAGTYAFGYDPSGRLSSITDPFTGQTQTSYTYDDAGRELTRTDPAGLTLTRGYDAAGRLYSESLAQGQSSPIASFSETLDPAGRVSDLTQTLPSPNTNSGTWYYTYTDSNELSQATAPAGTVFKYLYDGAGDRTSVQQVPNTAVTTSYDGAGRPTSASDGTTYTFDQADQLTAQGGPAAWVYGYDSWGRTTSAYPSPYNSQTALTYAYDPLDRRMVRTKGGAATTYKFSGTGQDLASRTVSGSSILYANSPGGPLAQSTAGVIKVFEPNLHGDLAVMASTSGASTGTAAYSPWGQKRSVTGDATSAVVGYQLDFTDPDSGLVDEGARNYDPNQGRFMTRDTLFGSLNSPMSLNQFVYGEDNPVSLTDPNGMCSDPYECPPPPGATKAVRDRWNHLAGAGDKLANHAYNGRGVTGANCSICTPSLVPAPPVPVVHVQRAASCGGWHVFGCALHATAHFVAQHKSAIIQGTIMVGLVALDVATDGAATPLLAEEVAADVGVEASEEVAATALENGAEEAAQTAADDGVGEAGNCNSFVRGTPVLLASGKTVPIQKVHVGTRVMSVDADHPNGRRVSSRVMALIRHPDAELYRLSADHTTIEATGNHPFFVRGRGWVRVRDLRRGMVLEEYSGKRVHLTRILREVSPTITVYNFEVARTHTYFAGRAEVLVHNCPAEEPMEKMIRERFIGGPSGGPPLPPLLPGGGAGSVGPFMRVIAAVIVIGMGLGSLCQAAGKCPGNSQSPTPDNPAHRGP